MDETKNIKSTSDQDTIDIGQIIKTLWRKAWIIAVSGVLTAAIFFCYAAFTVTPKYSSSVMLYINNSVSVGNFTTSVLTAARDLVNTYIVILKNRTTLEKVIEKSGVDYTYEQLLPMIEAGSAEETEIFRVTVTSTDPREAAKIANTIAEVLPDRVAEIIDGSSMRLVDKAVVSNNKISPDVTKITALGLAIGVLAACAVIVVMFIIDDTIYSDEYIQQTYDIPILAKIPNLLTDEKDHYGYRKTDDQPSVRRN